MRRMVTTTLYAHNIHATAGTTEFTIVFISRNSQKYTPDLMQLNEDIALGNIIGAYWKTANNNVPLCSYAVSADGIRCLFYLQGTGGTSSTNFQKSTMTETVTVIGE